MRLSVYQMLNFQLLTAGILTAECKFMHIFCVSVACMYNLHLLWSAMLSKGCWYLCHHFSSSRRWNSPQRSCAAFGFRPWERYRTCKPNNMGMDGGKTAPLNGWSSKQRLMFQHVPTLLCVAPMFLNGCIYNLAFFSLPPGEKWLITIGGFCLGKNSWRFHVSTYLSLS